MVLSTNSTLTPFGELCFRGRTAMTMTRPELARHVSTSPKDISDIETGKKVPHPKYVKLVTEILGLDPEEVFIALSSQYPEYELARISQPKYGAPDA